MQSDSQRERRARIVCTLGPASDSEEKIEELVRAGMNVARLNFSHGDHAQHRKVYDRVRRVADKLKTPVAILQDLQGPKIRVARFATGSTILKPGATFRFVMDDVEGNDERVSVTYKDLAHDVKPGEILLLDDGLMELLVEDVRDGEVITRVNVGGVLKNNKGINLPNTSISQPSLTAKDREDLEFGLELGVDYMALSFVRSGLDIHQLRCYLPMSGDAPGIIAKIEKPQAVQQLDEIINAAEGIMIARGDLGVELPPERVPLIQKDAIRRANAKGKLTIVATQMLESMTTNARPTRAEASDVANAILDGGDAVMLSGETAAGKYPVETVRMMSRIIVETETVRQARINVRPAENTIARLDGSLAIARAAQVAARELNLPLIACFTVSGLTPRLIKSFRPKRRILAFTPSIQTWRKMALFWGVEPIMVPATYDTDRLISQVEQTVVENGYAKLGDVVLIAMGHPAGVGSPTNMLKLHTIGAEPSEGGSGRYVGRDDIDDLEDAEDADFDSE